jgi:hypothetical protein
MQLRQYSCYCKKCSNGLYSEYPFKEVVRSRKHEPKRGGTARRRWMEEGWVEYTMGLKDDQEQRQLREISSEQRLAFVKGLEAGDVIGGCVLCTAGGRGEWGIRFFSGWPKSSAKAE